MKKHAVIAALLAGASLVSACGAEDDGSPTASENKALDNISEVLDASPDSLVADDTALGNGEAGATGELPVVGNEVVNDAAANGQ